MQRTNVEDIIKQEDDEIAFDWDSLVYGELLLLSLKIYCWEFVDK